MSRNIVWSWRDAGFGVVIAAVATIVIATGRVDVGLSLLVGAMPAAVIGLLPTRKARSKTVGVGILFGGFIMLGSFLAQWAAVAVIGMFALGMASALLAAKRPFGMIALSLCLPLAGVGLSYAGLENSVGLGLLIVFGSVVAYLWSLLLPEFTATASPKAPLMSPVLARSYGIRLGLVAATATATGFLLGVEHIGWITGAALFVMRPSKEMQELRSVGRIGSVFAGALAASWMLAQDLQVWIIALVGLVTLAGMAATHASRWYVTPAFTTFLVFWALLYGEASSANIEHRFWERVLETVLGVTIAYFFGLLLPILLQRRTKMSHP